MFRTNFLKENTIAILPPLGYHPRTKQSNIPLKWLSYTAEKNDVYIHTSGMVERRLLVHIPWMAMMRKHIQRMNCMYVSGTVSFFPYKKELTVSFTGTFSL